LFVKDCIKEHALSTEKTFNRMNANQALSGHTKLTKDEIKNMVRSNTYVSAMFAHDF
jgi:hypothetical protein